MGTTKNTKQTKGEREPRIARITRMGETQRRGDAKAFRGLGFVAELVGCLSEHAPEVSDGVFARESVELVKGDAGEVNGQ